MDETLATFARSYKHYRSTEILENEEAKSLHLKFKGQHLANEKSHALNVETKNIRSDIKHPLRLKITTLWDAINVS